MFGVLHRLATAIEPAPIVLATLSAGSGGRLPALRGSSEGNREGAVALIGVKVD